MSDVTRDDLRKPQRNPSAGYLTFVAAAAVAVALISNFVWASVWPDDGGAKGPTSVTINGSPAFCVTHGSVWSCSVESPGAPS